MVSGHRRHILFGIFYGLLVLTIAGSSAAQTTITFATWGSESNWLPYIESFEAQNPDVNVEIIALSWDEYWQKIDVMFAGGMDIDVVRLGGQHLPTFVARDMLLDIGAYVTRDLLMDEYIYPLLSSGMYKGVWYAMPEHSSVTNGFYNADLYNEAGLETPYDLWARGAWDWQTFVDLSQKMTQDKDGDGIMDQWGAHFPHTLEPVWQGLVRSNGGPIYNEDYTRLLLDDKRSFDALKFLTDLTTTYQVTAPPGMGVGFASGKLGLVLEKPSILNSWKETVTFEMGVVPVPVPVGGIETSAIVPNLLGIPTASKNPDAAWRLIAHLMSEEVQRQRIPSYAILSAHGQVVLDTIEQLPISHAEVLLDVANKSFPLQASLEYLQVEGVIRNALGQVISGTTSIEVAVQEMIMPQANRILAEAFKAFD